MESVNEYCELVQLSFKLKNSINYLKSRTDKEGFEYSVLAYAEDKLKSTDKSISSLKRKLNIT